MGQSESVPVAELPFGEALRELEAIVGQLEGGQLELEDSLERYERGVMLLRALQSRLSEAQQRVSVLMGELDDDAVEPSVGDE